MFINGAPIYWIIKKQSICEIRTYGSELTEMKQAVEYVCGIRYKLQIMGILCEDPAFFYGDNKSVLANTSMPGSTLKKKMNSLSYNFIREGCARYEWHTAYANTPFNLADLFTKCPPSGEKRWSFVRRFLHWL